MDPGWSVGGCTEQWVFSIPKPKSPKLKQVFRSSFRKWGGITQSSDGRMQLLSRSFLVAALRAEGTGREIVAAPGSVAAFDGRGGPCNFSLMET